MSVQVEITVTPMAFAALVAALRAKGVQSAPSRRRPGEVLLQNKDRRMYVSGYADETPVTPAFAEHCLRHLLKDEEAEQAEDAE